MEFGNLKRKSEPSEQVRRAVPSMPIVGSVNPYVSLKRSLRLISRISSAEISGRFAENRDEILDIFKKHNFIDFVNSNRAKLLDPDLYGHLELELYRLLIALDNESFGNSKRVKAVIAGGFSAGKSAFLNYIAGRKILPEATTPSTSVATYLFCQNDIGQSAVFCENKNGALVGLDEDLLRHIHHSSKSDTAIQIAATLNRFIVEIPHPDFQNVVFIDTPGFGNADSGRGLSMDDRTAKVHMAGADFMIYLVTSQKGVMAEDWQHIDEFGDKPVLLVITKNDLNAPSARSVFDLTVQSAKSHKNVKGVVSMSVKKPGFFLSTSNGALCEIINDIAGNIGSETEIERRAGVVVKLLDSEIEASTEHIKKIKGIFEQKKVRQNIANKESFDLSNKLNMSLDLLKETLLDDIDKSDKKVASLDHTLFELHEVMRYIHSDLTQYYSNRITSNGTLSGIICRMKSFLDNRLKEMAKVRKMSYGFCDSKKRKALLEDIRFLIRAYKKQLEDREKELDKECKELQDRIGEEQNIIRIFSDLRKDLKEWLVDKVGNLEHISFTPPPRAEAPDIFTAIHDMDEERIIDALYYPCDVSTKYNDDGFSPLTYAAFCGNIPALRLMQSFRSSKGDRIDINYRDRNNRTMLEAAGQKGHDSTMAFIVRNFN